MADGQGAWGIDIGQAGLKAIRLRYSESAKQVLAVAFDYVPHAKILSQPDAIAEELIPQALETFFSRNDVKGDKLAISVPGQTSLAKFIKLPPVESSKVAEIVKYEAKQQIPFDLDDVVWDYQPLGGGVEESGFMLEAEVGLFAMKRDQVMQHLQPFVDAKQEVELIQMAPLALYNFLSYDYLGHRKGEDLEETAENEYMIVLDMGADNTTLLVSNGRTIWIRNVPIGGNHFTRALTRDMKLTFAKAEHLKCNATRSPDPKAVFQSLRPVFNDYVSEIQRSIGYFSSVNRDARVKKVLGVGNGFKLAGLQKFLQQNLQYEVERVDSFEGVVGDSVLNAPLFQENVMSFAVPYGLALQSLDVTRIHTSLLPPEIKMARTIRRKKPWAVAAAALLLGSLGVSAVGNARVYNSVSVERFGTAEDHVVQLKGDVANNTKAFADATARNKKIVEDEMLLVTGLERREYWLEVYRAINECLPRDKGDSKDEKDITKRNRIKLTSIVAKKETDLGSWFAAASGDIQDMETMHELDAATPPEGEGYVFTIDGVHYRSDDNDPNFNSVSFIEETFLADLQKWQVDNQGQGELVEVRKMGITHPLVVNYAEGKYRYDPNRKTDLATRAANGGSRAGGAQGYGGAAGYGGGGYDGGGMAGEYDGGEDEGGMSSEYDGGTGMAGSGYPGSGGYGAAGVPKKQDNKVIGLDVDDGSREEVRDIKQTSFQIQFVWKPTPLPRPEVDPRIEAAAAAEAAEPAAP